MTLRGLGDQWLAGDRIAGIHFARHDAVRVAAGELAGESGSVVLLMHVRPEPLYLVQLDSGRGEVRLRQSALRPAA